MNFINSEFDPEATEERTETQTPKPKKEDVHLEDRREKVIRELRQYSAAKAKLKEDILSLVKEFEKETGKPITNINFSRRYVQGDFANEKRECVLCLSISTF